MKRLGKSPFITAVCLGLLFCLTVTVAVRLLLHNLFLFLSSPTLRDIFAQLRTASLRSPVLLLLLIAFLYWLPVCRHCRRTYSRILAAVGGLLIWLLLVALGAALTRVNGIRFGDVLLSLLDAAKKGWLEGV